MVLLLGRLSALHLKISSVSHVDPKPWIHGLASQRGKSLSSSLANNYLNSILLYLLEFVLSRAASVVGSIFRPKKTSRVNRSQWIQCVHKLGSTLKCTRSGNHVSDTASALRDGSIG